MKNSRIETFRDEIVNFVCFVIVKALLPDAPAYDFYKVQRIIIRHTT